jgi:GT2 family glycosyltransferase
MKDATSSIVPMTTTVIIVTLNRPLFLQKCLECLRAQTVPANQVIVVDSSPGDESAKVCSTFSEVLYLRNEHGFGRMTTSRNIGLLQATGDIIAFLDDDSFADREWLSEILRCYEDPATGAAGGRAYNGTPGEKTEGLNAIGTIQPNGTITGNFAADPGRIIEVDHIMGCNMSFRREVVARLGGFREDYPGISGVREDTDMSLRVKALGCRMVFNPMAGVEHVGAPQAVGRRFDARYMFYSARNHVVMLIRNKRFWSGTTWRYFFWQTGSALKALVRGIGKAVVMSFAPVAGIVIGVFSGLTLVGRSGTNAARKDARGEQIREKLSQHGKSIELAGERVSSTAWTDAAAIRS